MRIIINIAIAVIICAAMGFAQGIDTTNKQNTTPPVVTSQNDQKEINVPAGTIPKAPTNWSKIKDLFL